MTRPIAVLLLAAGFGTRLKPYTNHWPKCLMPINGRPLLEYWLDTARQLGAATVLVNTHYLADRVRDFLGRPVFKDWVTEVYEQELKGTAGTLHFNQEVLHNTTILMAHADNFCQCDFNSFLEFHQSFRPKNCLITMMTFTTREPSACGIVEIDGCSVVTGFYEKVEHPPGNLANGAVYLLEPEVLQWMRENPEASDFSRQVLPNFIGRIAVWHNDNTHVDIGTIEALRELQAHNQFLRYIDTSDDWSKSFASHPIHNEIRSGVIG